MMHPDDPTGAALLWPLIMLAVYATTALGWLVAR